MSLTIKLCKHGHELTSDNIYINPSGYVTCRICRKLSNRKHDNSNVRRNQRKKWNQTKVSKNYRKEYEKTPKRRKYQKNYQKSENGVRIRKRYIKSDKGITMTRKADVRRRKDIDHQIRIMNRQFIYYSKKIGTLVIKNICTDCGKHGYTQVHHEKYHNPPKLIDIRELCMKCHVKADKLLK